MSNRMAGVIVVALLPLLLAGWPYLTTFHLQHVLGGFGFALLIVCSHRSSIFSTLLSWRPLVKLGAISYSVYLVHAPVLQVCEYIAYPVLHRYPLLVLWGVASGIAAGATFHLGVEKRCMSRTTWLWLSPVLLRLLRWTDRVYPSPGRKTESGRGRASVRAVASN